MSATTLPADFAHLEWFVDEWAKPTREERYAVRLSKTFGELEDFYDEVAARADQAIAYLNGLELNSLPDDATRLLRLLYSFVLVSYAVNIFQQPRIPDSGAAFFDTAYEPVP
jgi:hypothetical protein